MDHHGKCPACNADWDAGPIPEKDHEFYGPPYRFSRLIGLEFPHVYDGVLEWQCPDCKAQFPRFARKENNHARPADDQWRLV